MILPGSFLVSLLVLILSLLCLGSWPNLFKSVSRKWRFELWYCDFAVGFVLAAVIAAFTLGSLGQDGFSFVDDFLLAGKKQDAFAFVAGGVFNLGNMLFVAAISIAGMTAAAPIALGTAVILGALLGPLMGAPSTPLLRLSGAAVLLVAVVGGALSYRRWAMARLVEAMQTGKTKSTKKVVNSKPIVLAVAAGLPLGGSVPLMQLGNDSEIKLGPYSFSFIFGLGILLSTFAYNLFFMNLPVQGKPVDMADYFKAKVSAHLAGLLGGAVALVGFLAGLLTLRAEGAAQLAPRLSYPIAQGAAFIAMLWGLIYWKEYESTDSAVNTWVVVTVIFFLGGLALLAFGQLPPVAAK
jgi:glucose uptake protein